MTAMSLIVQPHAAYLLTDTAHYLADGTAVSFAPKVAELHFGGIKVGRSARAAYALTGVVDVAGLNTVIDKAGLRYDDMRGFLAGLPDLIRGVSLALPNIHRAAGAGDSTCIGMAIAWWDDATGAPYGFLIGNEQFQPVAQGHMLPFTLTRMRNYVMQQGTFAFEGVDYSDPAQFDPVRDGGRLLDSQRLDPFGDDDNQFCGVGGQGVLTEVNESGVRRHRVRTWPDKIGDRIKA